MITEKLVTDAPEPGATERHMTDSDNSDDEQEQEPKHPHPVRDDEE